MIGALVARLLPYGDATYLPALDGPGRARRTSPSCPACTIGTALVIASMADITGQALRLGARHHVDRS